MRYKSAIDRFVMVVLLVQLCHLLDQFREYLLVFEIVVVFLVAERFEDWKQRAEDVKAGGFGVVVLVGGAIVVENVRVPVLLRELFGKMLEDIRMLHFRNKNSR